MNCLLVSQIVELTAHCLQATSCLPENGLVFDQAVSREQAMVIFAA